MSDDLPVPELPFPVTSSHDDVWRRDEHSDAVVGSAPPRTDLYRDPGAEDAAPVLNAATLLGTPAAEDFQLSARVTVDFRAQYDAGVLLLWADESSWAKLCFEFSPAGQPMVVSVVTRGVSDDANAFVVAERTVRLRISRLGRAYAFHACTDGLTWQLIRLFTLGDDLADHRVGLEVQSPTGEGCTAAFDEVRFTADRLGDLRDGS